MEEYILKFEELGLVPGSYIYDRIGNLWKVVGIEFCLNRKEIIPFLRCTIAQQRAEGPLTLNKRSFAIGKNTIGTAVFLPGGGNYGCLNQTDRIRTDIICPLQEQLPREAPV